VIRGARAVRLARRHDALRMGLTAGELLTEASAARAAATLPATLERGVFSYPGPWSRAHTGRMAEDVKPPAVEGYQVERLLGRGGMGSVWHARRESDGRDVAIKIITMRYGAESVEVARRFRREVQISCRLAHPNVVRVLDGSPGDAGREPYLVLEYLAGGSLRQIFDTGALLTPEQAVRIGIEACAGLD
jgi:serine/threonine protein kinase